jgi:preprotein translocase subunit YajC
MNSGFNFLAQAETAENVQPVISESIDAVEEVVSQDGSVPVEPNVPAGKSQSPFNPQMIFIVLMIAVVYFMLFRGPKQKQKKHQQMVSSLAKNDRVRTIGGIIGTIVDIRDDEVILKIDESNNTKMKVIKGAIATTLKDDIEKN